MHFLLLLTIPDVRRKRKKKQKKLKNFGSSLNTRLRRLKHRLFRDYGLDYVFDGISNGAFGTNTSFAKGNKKKKKKKFGLRILGREKAKPRSQPWNVMLASKTIEKGKVSS